MFLSSYRSTSESLREREILWEHEPQASVSTAFLTNRNPTPKGTCETISRILQPYRCGIRYDDDEALRTAKFDQLLPITRFDTDAHDNLFQNSCSQWNTQCGKISNKKGRNLISKISKRKWVEYLLVWQCTPPYPDWQLQTYLLTWSTHVPPLKQGRLEHSLISGWK